LVSVIIVNYNTGAVLRGALEALEGGEQCEVIVVDNASTDDATQAVRGDHPWVHWIQLGSNLGFGAANNRGAREASGDVLLLLNPDASISSEALELVHAICVDSSDTGAIGFRQVDEEGCWQLSVGLEPSLVSELARKVLQDNLDAGRHRIGQVVDRLLSRPTEVAWVAGSALAIRRSVFERVGGFDERFFLYFEDIDLCLRVRQEVGPVVYDPRVTLTHIRGVSARTAPKRSRVYYRESQVLFWELYGGSGIRGALLRRYAHYRLRKAQER